VSNAAKTLIHLSADRQFVTDGNHYRREQSLIGELEAATQKGLSLARFCFLLAPTYGGSLRVG